MLNRPSQLARLILSFYREEPQLKQLRSLTKCQIFRRWGVLYIRSRHLEIANEIADAAAVLREPIAQLRLAKKIAILVNSTTILELPVNPPKIKA